VQRVRRVGSREPPLKRCPGRRPRRRGRGARRRRASAQGALDVGVGGAEAAAISAVPGGSAHDPLQENAEARHQPLVCSRRELPAPRQRVCLPARLRHRPAAHPRVWRRWPVCSAQACLRTMHGCFTTRGKFCRLGGRWRRGGPRPDAAGGGTSPEHPRRPACKRDHERWDVLSWPVTHRRQRMTVRVRLTFLTRPGSSSRSRRAATCAVLRASSRRRGRDSPRGT
jgi:hypothetical protein